jgi:hypothetical protein
VRVRIGDIIEVRTPGGLVYAIYTHKHVKHPRYGAMIRVFDKMHAVRPDSLAEAVKYPVMFTTFYPLQAAVNKQVVEVVGNVPVPDRLKAFPVFRVAGLADQATNRVSNWWLWDGEKEWRVGVLTAEQRKLPIRGVWNHEFLVDRISEGWRPENDRQ